MKAFVQNIDRTKAITAGAVGGHVPSIIYPRDGAETAIRVMERNNHSSVFVTDTNRMLKGLVTVDDAVKLRETGRRGFDKGTYLRFCRTMFIRRSTFRPGLL